MNENPFAPATPNSGRCSYTHACCPQVFPAHLRGFGGGATSAFAFLFFFSVVKTGPELFAALTPAGAFAAYGSMALCGSVFLLAFLPETKNRTLQEIEEEMAGPSPHQRRKGALAEP